MSSFRLDPLADLHFLRYPDGSLSQLQRDGAITTISGCRATRWPERFQYQTFVDDIADVLRAWQLATIYLPHSVDAHPDHRASRAAVLEALVASEISQQDVESSIQIGGRSYPGPTRR